ncbi:rhodanese-like domain-containing protein [Halobacteria archaeon AArc-m2/3/4]|uniref:Rhodanese-like domain-containing protein n=1 Tax=Natronoglomus mannanivorans TaxID=2979990 RepID=A0ABT2QDJ3_9EURY|nr:rhodanese-like domain-containing protein [Halobacteria archaeon AArc-m2/3/4]
MNNSLESTRRRVLVSVCTGLAATAGCLTDESDPSTDDGAESAGAETDTEASSEAEREPTQTESTDTDDAEHDYETERIAGVDVPLVPVDDAYEWHQEESARFVDARSEHQYERGHIAGAVLSPAPDGLEEDDPVADWDREETIVTYCDCPHTLAGHRAAALVEDGYEDVYAIDEGSLAWRDRGYPMVGEDVVETSYTVRGRTDTAGDGATVVAEHEPTGQREAAVIDDDGSYELTLRFDGLTEESPITLETPDYWTEATLGELVDGEISSDGSIET